MKTVYTQGDAAALALSGKAMRSSAVVFVTMIPEGTEVEVEGPTIDIVSGDGAPVAVVSNGSAVYLMNQVALDGFQSTKRPPATPPTPKKRSAGGSSTRTSG